MALVPFRAGGQKLYEPKPLEQAPIPGGWTQTLYGPGAPIRPTAKPWEEDIPRAIDYPPNVNATISPRTSYGLMPFNALKLAYETIDEYKHIVSVLISQMCNFSPTLTDTKGNDVSDTSAFNWFLESPDRATSWSEWLTRFLECTIVYDAGCLCWNTDTLALEYVDGSTMFLLVDEHGHTPQPPEPAYVQIIHGIPFKWYSSDKIWYRPRFPRADAPYGRSPCEKSWTACLILANINGFELAHYREGNLPEGIVFQDTDEGELNPEQAEAWEQTLNSVMKSDLAERARVKFVPFKAGFIATKKPDFPQALYDSCYYRLGLSCGVPRSELGEAPKGGLGGKGYQDVATQSYFRIGLAPLIRFTNSACNEFLRTIGCTDRFDLQMPTQGLDPQVQSTIATNAWKAGGKTLNEYRAANGDPPVKNGDLLLIVNGNGTVTNLSDLLSKGVPPQTPPGQKPPVSDSSDLSGVSTDDGPGGTSSGDSTKSLMQVSSRVPSTTKALRELPVRKICGVDEGDDAYYGAPLAAPDPELDVPFGGHANEVFIVAIAPKGKEPRTGIWKPAYGENPKLVDRVGHYQYLSEAAAYILDRTLGFHCVPVAYITEVDGNVGSVSMYVTHRQAARDPADYSPVWVERCAVLDYLTGNPDRRIGDGTRGNYLTHPTDDRRPVLIDQGLCFPTTDLPVKSPFVDAVANEPFSPDMAWLLKHATNWNDLWSDLESLVGEEAIDLVKQRLAAAVDAGGIPIAEQHVAPDTSVPSGSTYTTDDGTGNGSGGNTQ